MDVDRLLGGRRVGVLLAITFAATHIAAINKGGGGAVPIIETALSSGLAKLVLDISTVGQLFCGMGCVAAASRMVFAFSRDGAVPGHSLWRRLNKHRTPTWAVFFVVVLALIITIPALFGNKAGLPVAFFAVTSITTIGLYIAYILPVFLRWRMGNKFEPGVWNLGKHYRVDQRHRDHLGRDLRGHLLPADVARGGSVGQWLQLE